jgi:hypothetical protein
VSAAVALYHGLTLERHGDPDAIRPDLVTRVVRALGAATHLERNGQPTQPE